MGKYCGNCGKVDESEPAHKIEYGTCTETGVQVYLANPSCKSWEPEEFVFLNEDNEPRYCRLWGHHWWLFYWHPDKKWVSLQPITIEEVASLPRNLSKEHQAIYFPQQFGKFTGEQPSAMEE